MTTPTSSTSSNCYSNTSSATIMASLPSPSTGNVSPVPQDQSLANSGSPASALARSSDSARLPAIFKFFYSCPLSRYDCFPQRTPPVLELILLDACFSVHSSFLSCILPLRPKEGEVGETTREVVEGKDWISEFSYDSGSGRMARVVEMHFNLPEKPIKIDSIDLIARQIFLQEDSNKKLVEIGVGESRITLRVGQVCTIDCNLNLQSEDFGSKMTFTANIYD